MKYTEKNGVVKDTAQMTAQELATEIAPYLDPNEPRHDFVCAALEELEKRAAPTRVERVLRKMMAEVADIDAAKDKRPFAELHDAGGGVMAWKFRVPKEPPAVNAVCENEDCPHNGAEVECVYARVLVKRKPEPKTLCAECFDALGATKSVQVWAEEVE